MIDSAVDVLVVGAGAFGASSALALSERGYRVALLDPGPLPHPEASSTDISKMVRMDYGSDRFYARMGEHAIAGWREWNRLAERELYHETGFLLLAGQPLAPGGFEYESARVLEEMGYAPERVGPALLSERFPAWNAALYPDGYRGLVAGWAESGHVVAWLLERCAAGGVELREGARAAELLVEGGRVRGVVDSTGEAHAAESVVVAAGAWTPALLPWLGDVMWAVGQPVYHFAPADPAPYEADVFPPWAADIATTGWYGFPAQPDGVVKIANHGAGLRIDPNGPKAVPGDLDERFHEFVRGSLPGLSSAPIVKRRLCMYCDTFDGDFWIDRDPERSGLIVAAGGSGHGFKFAPLLGPLVADLVEGVENRWAERFRWRDRASPRYEEARSEGGVFS